MRALPLPFPHQPSGFLFPFRVEVGTPLATKVTRYTDKLLAVDSDKPFKEKDDPVMWALEDIFCEEAAATTASKRPGKEAVRALGPYEATGFSWWGEQAKKVLKHECSAFLNTSWKKSAVVHRPFDEWLADPKCKYVAFSFALKEHKAYTPADLRGKASDEVHRLVFEDPWGKGTAARRVHDEALRRAAVRRGEAD